MGDAYYYETKMGKWKAEKHIRKRSRDNCESGNLKIGDEVAGSF